MAGPFTSPPLQHFRTSPIGVVPKKEPNKFRMITDLSSPRGLSINDFISDEEASVTFNNFDTAVNIVAKLGQGALMAKLDVKSAFRICPVNKSDWHLLGFTFMDMFFVDLCLPFGLRSSVNRFTQVSDSILWIMQNNYDLKNSTNYLDDFFLAAPPDSNRCQVDMCRTITLFKSLGVPLADEKLVGPTSCITFLGIEINSDHMSLGLPQPKCKEIQDLIKQWSNKKKCTKRELLSLIGKLSFAAKVVPSGRTFIRRLIDLSKSVVKLSHHISLNNEARQDIQWWADYLPSWNGRYRILDPTTTPCHTLDIFTDASGEIGLGIFYKGRWVSERWPDSVKTYSIQWKELYPIYLACLLWAPEFRGRRLLFHCDNLAVVNIWSAQSSKCPKMMSLLRKLFFVAARFEFTVNVKHIPGLDNSIADCLSRSQLNKFFRLVPAAQKHPTRIPAHAWQV